MDNANEAARERFAALEALEAIGEVYYARWLETGEILPEALEDCMEVKKRRDAAERLDAAAKRPDSHSGRPGGLSPEQRRALLLKRPVTEKYDDLSAPQKFSFVFYCDCCKKPFPAIEYAFVPLKRRLFRKAGKRPIKLQWLDAYEAAFERANRAVETHLCEICGRRICRACAVYCNELEGGVCCEGCLEENGYHGEKMDRSDSDKEE